MLWTQTASSFPEARAPSSFYGGKIKKKKKTTAPHMTSCEDQARCATERVRHSVRHHQLPGAGGLRRQARRELRAAGRSLVGLWLPASASASRGRRSLGDTGSGRSHASRVIFHGPAVCRAGLRKRRGKATLRSGGSFTIVTASRELGRKLGRLRSQRPREARAWGGRGRGGRARNALAPS